MKVNYIREQINRMFIGLSFFARLPIFESAFLFLK